MNAYRVTIAELTDLSEITVICGSCRTRMILPVTAPIPDTCSACNKEFDEPLRNALGAFTRFYREAKVSKSQVEFAIKEKLSN
jgi:uncharacterized CHY-type Zn-finger protein